MPRKKRSANGKITVPPAHDWRTTDADEIDRRRLRAQTERFAIRNTDAGEPVFSHFRVESATGMAYSVEMRDVARRRFACECVDFSADDLGTCKHVEAVLLHLRARLKGRFKEAVERGPEHVYVVPDPTRNSLRPEGSREKLSRALRRCFEADGGLGANHTPEEWLQAARRAAGDVGAAGANALASRRAAAAPGEAPAASGSSARVRGRSGADDQRRAGTVRRNLPARR